MPWVLSMTLLFVTFAFAASLTEQQKIDALIHSIEVLPDAQFIRNGSATSPISTDWPVKLVKFSPQ